MFENTIKSLQESLAQEVSNFELYNLYDYIFENYELTANRPRKSQNELEIYTDIPISTIKRITSGQQVSVDTACRFILSFPLTEQELINCISLCLGVDLNTKVYGYYKFAIKKTFEKFPILEFNQECYRFRRIDKCKLRREYYEFIINNENLIKPKYHLRNNALR